MEKKERRQITTAQKLQIIQTVDENPNMKRIGIARMMKIPSSTLKTILAKRKTLESACNDGNLSTRKRIRSGNFAELEEVLLKWFKQVRTANCSGRWNRCSIKGS
ncbi:Major centromere autoantigen B [Trichinella zimbabwensis]|uniref:Major centromere autoantigen B n=1 Tax=Trichinella zimbabwensis TaxID=268475 RepID=A0A0V1HLB7_9BILA|nr:Major centromere autoantigen B [Trichinella zimbabwensis]